MMKPDLFSHIGRPGVLLFIMCLCITFFLSCGSEEGNLTAGGGIGGTGVTDGTGGTNVTGVTSVTGVTIGEVSDYGSIIVNGVEFDTKQADLYVEGAYVGTGDQVVHTQLPIGRQVVVQGDFTEDATGSALQIDAFYRVQGPLRSIIQIDNDSCELIVMGQTVYADRQTTLSGVTLESLESDMVLQISGPLDVKKTVHAGHIALLAQEMSPDITVGIKGNPYLINTRHKRFRVNTLIVDYSQVPNAPYLPWIGGLPIAVEGKLKNNILTAQSLRIFDTEYFESVENFSMDGIITSPLSANFCRMGNYRILISATTRFEGLTPDELKIGIRVHVSGELVNGVLYAKKVTAASRVRLESDVATVKLIDRIVTLEGIDEINIHTNLLTHIYGNAHFLAGIAPGDHVNILAYSRADGSVTATNLFVRPTDLQDNRFVLQGPVTLIADAQFDILNKTVTVDPNEGIIFGDISSGALSVEDFMWNLSIGALVRVTGHREGPQLLYDEMIIIR